MAPKADSAQPAKSPARLAAQLESKNFLAKLKREGMFEDYMGETSRKKKAELRKLMMEDEEAGKQAIMQSKATRNKTSSGSKARHLIVILFEKNVCAHAHAKTRR